MKALAFLFHSDYMIHVAKTEVNDGRLRIENKEFFVEKTRPFFMKTTFGVMPVYFLNWKSFFPMDNTSFRVYDSGITPEMKKRAVELKIFSFLLKRFAGTYEMPMGWKSFFFMILGALVTFLLFYLKIIKI